MIINCRALLPNSKLLGIILCIIFGTSSTILLRLIILVPSSLVSSMSFVAQFAFTRVFSVIYFCCYMMLWRGWWSLFNMFTPPLSLLLGLGISVLFLTCSLSSNVGPPLAFSHDTKYDNFNGVYFICEL